MRGSVGRMPREHPLHVNRTPPLQPSLRFMQALGPPLHLLRLTHLAFPPLQKGGDEDTGVDEEEDDWAEGGMAVTECMLMWITSSLR